MKMQLRWGLISLLVILLISAASCRSVATSTSTTGTTSPRPTPTSSGTFPRRGSPTTTQPTSPTSTSTASNSISVYSDLNDTQPITSIEWGTLEQGASSTQSIYLENKGNQDVTVTASGTGLSSGLALTADPNPVTLASGLTSTGEVPSWHVELTLTGAGNAASGDSNFTINIGNVQIPSHVMVAVPSQPTSTPTPTLTSTPTPTPSS